MSETIFSGHFNIKKFRPEPDLPVNKNHWVYYVDHDWELPVGFVWYPRPFQGATGATSYDGYATLMTAFWFKGAPIDDKGAVAYLFLQGREITNTKAHGQTFSEVSSPAQGSDRT